MARSASTSASDARRTRARLTDKLDSIHRSIAIAGSGSNWRGGAPFGVGNPENWLGLVKPDGRDGLVRVPGGKAANWSCGGMMWTDECRRHVDRVSPVIHSPLLRLYDPDEKCERYCRYSSHNTRDNQGDSTVYTSTARSQYRTLVPGTSECSSQRQVKARAWVVGEACIPDYATTFKNTGGSRDTHGTHRSSQPTPTKVILTGRLKLCTSVPARSRRRL